MTAKCRKIIIFVLAALLGASILSGCKNEPNLRNEGNAPDFGSLKTVREVPVLYASQFSATEYEGGYYLISIDTSGEFLVIPDGKPVPNGLDEKIMALHKPLDRIYLAATSAMDFFRALDGIENVRLSGTKKEGWYIDEAKQALDDGSMIYAGKYSAPDYELIYSEGCNLAIESTMIYHAPKVKEQFESMGIPVLTERSSYEEHPLGRMEWLKVYGILLGKTDEAIALFDAETERISPLLESEETGKTVAFFYITSTNAVNVRKSCDYFAKMIEMAGGRYIFENLDSGSQLSTVNMTMESFYDGARDADILIYNSTIDGEIYTVDELLGKSEMLSEFKAVKSGDVWCIGKNLFQESMALGRLTEELHNVLIGNDDYDFSYLHKLRN